MMQKLSLLPWEEKQNMPCREMAVTARRDRQGEEIGGEIDSGGGKLGGLPGGSGVVSELGSEGLLG